MSSVCTGTLVPTPTPLFRLAYRMEEAAEATGISRSALYADARAGKLATRKRGSATIILTEDLAAYLRALPRGN